MKKFYITVILFVIAFSTAFSQVPGAINYQAVVRNSSGEIVVNQNVSFRISVLQDTESGTVVYSETHTLSTNDYGLANFEIGGGTVESGSFTPTGWGANSHFIKVEFDAAGGTAFSHLGTSKLTSVPYAFHAQTVANDAVDDADADPANEIQTISLNGTLLELSNGGGSVTLPASGGSAGDNWGAQVVRTNSTLTGNGTTATPLAVVADGDGDDSNELQTLSLTGSYLSLSDGGGTVTLPSSPWSESSLEVSYRGTKSVYIGESSGSAAKTKSEQISDPAKLKVSVDNIPAIEVYSESSTYSAVDVWNEEGIAARFGGNSDKPVAIFDNADSGLAAQFKDKIQIEDGTQGAGKVLTSDASGNASWQAPSAGGSSAWTESGSDVYRASGKVSIGKAPTGTIKLDVKTDESWIAIKGENNSPTYGAIYLKNNGTGPAADLRSPIKIMDGTQGDGKVLTSDASGNASWQAPASGGSSLWTESGSDIYRASGKIGIGTANPNYTIDVHSASESAGLQLISTKHTYIILNRTAGDDASINFKTDGNFKFKVGLLLNEDVFSIVTTIDDKGLKIDNHGNLNLTDNLTVDGDLFVNQNLDVADDLSVGSVTISGSEINKTSTGAANMMPMAYGFVTSNGTLKASSGNVSVSRTALGKYMVTITGQSYNDDDFVAVFSHAHSRKSLGHEESAGKIAVYITKNSDDAYDDASFSFIIYKM